MIKLTRNITKRSRPETSIKAEDVPQEDNCFQNYYALSSLRLGKVATEVYPATIVHVVSKVFVGPDGFKQCILVEEVDCQYGPFACLIYWYGNPQGVELVAPGKIFRFENIRTRIYEDNKYHPFQLELTPESQISAVHLPPNFELSFSPQSILEVTKGYHEFMDFSGRLVDKHPGDQCEEFIFTDEKNPTQFILRSEKTDEFILDEFMKYKFKTLKIRSAKVLERSKAETDTTIIYKNIAAILHFNK